MASLGISLTSILYTIVVSQVHSFIPTLIGNTDLVQLNTVYFRSFPRITVFITGMVVGFVYLSTLQRSSKVSYAYENRKNYGDRFEKFCYRLVNIKWLRQFLYLFGTILSFCSCFLAGLMIDTYGNDVWPQFVNSCILGLQRPFFIIGISFWIFPMLLGHCKPVCYLLSSRVFAPIAKISYSLYLVHYFVIAYMLLSGMHIQEGVGIMILVEIFSYLAGFLLTLLIENPILSIERYYLRR